MCIMDQKINKGLDQEKHQRILHSTYPVIYSVEIVLFDFPKIALIKAVDQQDRE